MQLAQSRIAGVTVTAAIFLLGSQSLAEGCVSATLADEVYYSCSGVLTVVPKETGEGVDSSRDGALQKIERKSERPDGTPAGSEDRRVTRNP
jgi:hypothetical protein